MKFVKRSKGFNMTGLELSRAYFEEYGRAMIENDFAEYKGKIAAGLVGHGSECFGFDDDVSRDHDFEPGFCLWITDEDDKTFGFKLFRAYSKLPREFGGVKLENKSIYGLESRGVHTINEFYSFYTPSGSIPETLDEWMSIPEYYLAEATNGEVFYDPLGEFSRIREGLLHGLPEDAYLARLASSIFEMAQSGQYNYVRCLKHGQNASAAVALTKFAESAAHTVYLLNKRYMPYYKWAFRGLEGLPILNDLKGDMEYLLSEPYNKERNVQIIEGVAQKIISVLCAKDLCVTKGDYLEPYAYMIKEHIKDNFLRNSSVII